MFCCIVSIIWGPLLESHSSSIYVLWLWLRIVKVTLSSSTEYQCLILDCLKCCCGKSSYVIIHFFFIIIQ